MHGPKKPDTHIYTILPVIQLKEEPITRFFRRKPEKPNVDHLIDVLLHDKSNDKRYDAAVRLGMLHDPKAVPALSEAAIDRSFRITTSSTRYVQNAATEALGEIGGPEAIEMLKKLLRQSQGGRKDHATEALKKLGAFDILQKYHPFWNQDWYRLILYENGNIRARESSLEDGNFRPLHLEPGDYVRIEYSIAEVDENRKPYDRSIARPRLATVDLGIVALEARRLHFERAFYGPSTLDLTSDPVELTPVQRKAFKDWFQSTYGWYRATKEIEKILR